MSNLQPELVGLPAPTRATAGRCNVPSVYGGAGRPCSRQAVGTVAHWLAPLDPAQATPCCEECARAYFLLLEEWMF